MAMSSLSAHVYTPLMKWLQKCPSTDVQEHRCPLSVKLAKFLTPPGSEDNDRTLQSTGKDPMVGGQYHKHVLQCSVVHKAWVLVLAHRICDDCCSSMQSHSVWARVRFASNPTDMPDPLHNQHTHIYKNLEWPVTMLLVVWLIWRLGHARAPGQSLEHELWCVSVYLRSHGCCWRFHFGYAHYAVLIASLGMSVTLCSICSISLLLDAAVQSLTPVRNTVSRLATFTLQWHAIVDLRTAKVASEAQCKAGWTIQESCAV